MQKNYIQIRLKQQQFHKTFVFPSTLLFILLVRSLQCSLPMIKHNSTPIYSNSVLGCFVKAYPAEWLDDGITKETMDKFGILYSISQNKIIEIDLEEYVKGVIAGEMPISFNIEALKAQAIVARTYTVYKINNKKHV